MGAAVEQTHACSTSERCPTQAVLPLVGLAAEKIIRDPYISSCPSNTQRLTHPLYSNGES
ncbi:MAG: hypothetical protein ACQESR_14305 [Planctomycetota bacterium]